MLHGSSSWDRGHRVPEFSRLASCSGGAGSGGAKEQSPTSPSYGATIPTCTYDVTPLALTFDMNGGTGQFTVTTTDACGWYAGEPAALEDWAFYSTDYYYGTGTITVSVSAGDTPAGYPAPREGELPLREPGTNNFLGHNVTVTQTGAFDNDLFLGTWTGVIEPCHLANPPGETCIATVQRLFTVTFTTVTDIQGSSVYWSTITDGQQYTHPNLTGHGPTGLNWTSQEADGGTIWEGSANARYGFGTTFLNRDDQFDMHVYFGDGQRYLSGEFDGVNTISGLTNWGGPDWYDSPTSTKEFTMTKAPSYYKAPSH